MRIGIGFDVHSFAKNRKLILGGIEIPYEYGLLGHSDADVLIHAIIDCILGALSLGDIGQHFPDTDNKYKDISSVILLKEVKKIINNYGYMINNIDTVIIAQNPKLLNYISEMQQNLAYILEINKYDISVKATTTEKLGFTGRGEGIAVKAVCLLKKEN